MYWNSETDKLPFPVKAVALVIVALFVVIGVIGLVLPVIPGIVFLGLAALLLAKVSSRFAFFLDQQPLWHRLRRQWRSLRLMSLTQRIKLMGLYCLRGLIDGLETAFSWLRNRVR